MAGEAPGWDNHRLASTRIPNWGAAKEVQFAADPGASQEPAALARAILKKLDIDGPHRIIGQPSAKEMTIWRNSAAGDYKIIWRRDQSRVTVQRQQPPSVQRVLHSLHFGRGYDRRYIAATVWALSVDAVIVSTWFWVVSGIYIWARRPKQRLWGGICLAGGGLLFTVLAILLSR